MSPIGDNEAEQKTSERAFAEPMGKASEFNCWWQIADLSVFGVWLVLVAAVLSHHEPWADESQAWLLARDLDLKTLWLHELRYEGTPGLWHTILWVAQHWLHVPYVGMGVLGMVCAAMGVGFILWKASFPRPLRYLLVFSYFISYQYAVVARSYNLLPLLMFAAAYFYCDREHPWRITLVLIVLANVAVHGALFAACLGLCYLIEAIKVWSKLDQSLRNRYVFCVGAMLLTFLCLFFILQPDPDVLEFAGSKAPPGAHVVEPPLNKFLAVIDLAFFDQFWVSAAFLLFAGGWCLIRRKLLPFILPVLSLTMLYVKIHGRPHHMGTVFLAAVAGLWIAWPTKKEITSFSSKARLAMNGMTVLLVCLCCLNIWDAESAMKNDYLHPYSGSEDAARFLKQVGAERFLIFGYTYGTSAVQAYFNHNILRNMPTTYFHEGLPLYGYSVDLDAIQAAAPDYLLIFNNDPRRNLRNLDKALNKVGYHLVRFSRGDLYFKRFVFDASDYLIYQHD